MIAIGHLIGYGAGSVNLLKVFGTALGDSQFKQLTLIAAIALILAVGVTSYAVQERILIAGRFVVLLTLTACSLSLRSHLIGTQTPKMGLSKW